MRVVRAGHKNPIPVSHCNFWIYDETKEYDEKAAVIKSLDEKYTFPEDFRKGMIKAMLESTKNCKGAAFGHPYVCFFATHKDKPTVFEFAGDRNYSVDELKLIMRKASAAARRCKWG